MDKQSQRLPTTAKTLNALANMIKRNQYKPIEEDISALARFILDRKREGDNPSHLFLIMATKGYREMLDKIADKIRDIAPDEAINLEDFPALQRLGEIRKQILAALEQKWSTGNYKKAELDVRKKVLANLKKKWDTK